MYKNILLFIVTLFTIIHSSVRISYSQSWYPISQNTDTIRIYSFYRDSTTNETYIGGDFHEFAGVMANNIIKWNGNQWLPVGDGFNHPVHSITKYKDTLVAAGEFDSSGTTHFKMPIAKWNGINWTYFNDSTVVVHFLWSNARPIIHDVEEFDNRLFIIGEIEHDGPFPGTYNFEYFAVWNDTIWQRGVRGSTLADPFFISDMAVYQNDLYIVQAVGYDTCIASGQQGSDAFGLIKYNPSCWSVEQVGVGWQNTLATTLIEFNNSLYIGMEINHPQYGSFVTRYDGSNFFSVGLGFNAHVEYFTVYNGKLCAVGAFTADGLNQLQFPNHIAQWDGISWADLPSTCNLSGWKINKAGVIDSTIFVDGFLEYCGATNLLFAATYPNNLTNVNELVQEGKLKVTVSPNPTNSEFTITNSQSFHCKVTFELYDFFGKRVYSQIYEYIDSTFKVIVPPEINQGVYLIKLSTSSYTITEKIVLYLND